VELRQDQKVYDILNQLQIPYKKYEHAAVFTMEDVIKLKLNLPECKNLFVRNTKGNKHYLVILEGSKKADLKKLATQIGSTKLSFASKERLFKYLMLLPGSVSPFGLINDKEKQVEVIVDKDLVNSDVLGFHPNTNEATVTLSFNDFEKFLKSCGNKFSYIKI